MFGQRKSGPVQSAKILALDSITSNVMIADRDLNILYLNRAVTSFLREAEADIRAELPHFNVDKLVGANIDVFHKQPHRQRGLLAGLKGSYRATIVVGKRTFDLQVAALLDRGEVCGFAVEWADASARVMNEDLAGQLAAISRSQAVIEFDTKGVITAANQNFLDTMGYSLQEIIGAHHSMFVDPAYRSSDEYRAFWVELANGEYKSAEFRRVGKGGREVWIQGAYNPIMDKNGKVTRVVKFAVDVTARVRAVADIGAALTALSSGDLMRRVEQPLTPELDKLRLDYNAAAANLGGVLRNVEDIAKKIRGGADEIKSASDDMSRRTEHQAASLAETSSALAEITGTVKKTSDATLHARDVVGKAKQDAERSGGVVRHTIEAMSSIEQSSRQIGQIISVIDEIAFQTNLLALNAGVEAARAGEAGRGFAVVASEVRGLAQRSADAAKEIKELVSQSATRVAQGVSLVNETGGALERIVTQVNQINAIVTEIADLAQSQSQGIQEVNIAVSQMDQMTQQNAAMAEESTAATHELAHEALALDELVGKFALSDHPGGFGRASDSDALPQAVGWR